jgi:hypothetical protein
MITPLKSFLKNRILSFTFFFITVLALQLETHAQSEWQKGYIIKSQRDTLYGFIEFKDWATSPSNIVFKDSITNTPVTYRAADIDGFTITSKKEYYQSEKVLIVYYKRQPVGLNDNPILRMDSVHAFLEVLLAGKSIALLEYLDEMEAPRFFVRSSDGLIQLQNIEYMVAKDGGTFRASQPVYRAQLKGLMSGCKTIDTKSLYYIKTSMINIFKKYFSCVNEENKLRIDHERGLAFDFEVHGGWNNFITEDGPYIGVSVRYLVDKKFFNRFVSAGVGKLFVDPYEYYTKSRELRTRKSIVYLSLYGGRYFGHGKTRPFIFTGYSSLNGVLDTGVGLSYNKNFSLSCHSGAYLILVGGISNFSIEARLVPFGKKSKN